MRKSLVVLAFLLLLSGCERQDHEQDALRLRASIQNGCSFDVKITADYGDLIYRFVMNCACDGQGNLQFTVRSPESIAGITGNISAGVGKLTFDDTALAFSLLADGQLSPISGPWIMMKALLGGYLTSAGADGEYSRVTIKDSYEADAYTVDVWLSEDNIPVRGEILWKNRRVLTMDVENFQIM